jgi:lysozyme
LRSPTQKAVALVTALAASLALVQAASADDYARGVDVSNHQGRIAWSEVSDNIKFVLVKATEGASFQDTWYPRNEARAHDQGIEFGAYHFARPAGTTDEAITDDARAEARFFVTYASPRGRHLLPVLDLEQSGALSPKKLRVWVRAWLAAVEARVGVKPMIYTYPDFWRTAAGDSHWFAENGYRVLWIANWDVNSPDVPADNWDGEGWTFWQYTDCGAVKGIGGCVDKDKYRYSSFNRVRIRNNR